MKKINSERRAWLENRRRKIERLRSRRLRKSFGRSILHIEQKNQYGEYSLTAPKNFSLMNNLDETLQYFHRVNKAIQMCRSNTILYFDLSAIEDASPDAFMYVVALLKNNRKIQMLQIPCVGNEPIADKPRSLLNKAGFFNYVISRRFHPIENEESQLRIYRGSKSDPSLAQKMCEFVHIRTGEAINRLGTKRLFPMFIELMNNVKQHAFDCDNTEDANFRNWYTYAEDIGSELRFVFLDTGKGIPETIQKNFWEKLPLVKTDARFISSALKGDFRTDTGERHRGKGLPEIYDNVRKHAIKSLSILSGKGLCIVDGNGNITEKNLVYAFDGTMYMWTIEKKEEVA